MDCIQMGQLIRKIRQEKNLTQKELAAGMNLSDKTISKWERGQGCPDVSLLPELSNILGVSVEKLLKGDLQPSRGANGNMQKLKFYVCPGCGAISSAEEQMEISCCGRKLKALVSRAADAAHSLTFEQIEDDLYITFPHNMEKTHYISFFAYVGMDRVLLIKLYPEQASELRFPKPRRGKLYYYCTQDGLWEVRI